MRLLAIFQIECNLNQNLHVILAMKVPLAALKCRILTGGRFGASTSDAMRSLLFVNSTNCVDGGSVSLTEPTKALTDSRSGTSSAWSHNSSNQAINSAT